MQCEEFAEALNVAFREKDYGIEVDTGVKYAKLVLTSNRGGTVTRSSVFAFIELSSGDIIKAAGWNAPQRDKGGLAVRGNIYDPVDCKRLLDIADPYGLFLYKR